MISLDTTRRDHLGCYGNPWIRTPALDRLAAESILFTDYMAVAPTTLASHTALFTGTYPHTHGTPRNGFLINPRNVMLTELLGQSGFRTGAVIGSFALSSRFGFDAGFDDYDESYDLERKRDRVHQSQKIARSTTDVAISYLEGGLPKNLFFFVHYFDPHAPYFPRDDYVRDYLGDGSVARWLDETVGVSQQTEREMAARYAGEITYMDEHIGRLLAYLRRRGILDDSLLIVTSDHGENLWDHFRNWDHGNTVYQSTMDAVCMIRLPGGAGGGQMVGDGASSIDVLPTILQFLGLRVPPEVEGRSVDISGTNISAPPRARFGQATKPQEPVETDPRWHNIRKAACVRDGALKYIETPHEEHEELYDLSSDPQERENLLIDPSPKQEAAAARLRGRLRDWVDSAAPLSSEFVRKDRDDTIRRLESLGYLK